MGVLIKSHWARLVVMTAAAYQIAAALESFFWPKVFWDVFTKTLDNAVKPFPVLQIINLLAGGLVLSWEWPLSSRLFRNVKARLYVLPMVSIVAALLYQGTNPALYYIIGACIYFWGYVEGEVLLSAPWETTIPLRLALRN